MINIFLLKKLKYTYAGKYLLSNYIIYRSMFSYLHFKNYIYIFVFVSVFILVFIIGTVCPSIGVVDALEVFVLVQVKVWSWIYAKSHCASFGYFN